MEQVRHPSALDLFDEITSASKGKQIVMFLDYDGTLSPIVEDPDRAFMSEAVRKTHYTCLCVEITHNPINFKYQFVYV